MMDMSLRKGRLLPFDAVEEGESAAAVAKIGGEKKSLLLVRKDDIIHAYINECPHIGAPLDFTEGQFLTLDKTMIQCATHGAKFRIEDGECLAGPCVGDHLIPVPVRVESGWIILDS